MKRIAQHFYLAGCLAGLAVLLNPQTPVCQTADHSEAPAEFTSIELTPEGVVATDSTGTDWVYDFDQRAFVLSDQTAFEVGGPREPGTGEETAEPVEIRCTERLSVDLPALRAVYVGTDEYVDGNILASGRVTVKGWVKGSVQSFNKTVLITSTGQVDGDVKAPEVVVKPGGVVLGEVIESPELDVPLELLDDRLATEGIWVVVGFSLALALIVFLTASLAPRQMTNVTDCVRQYPARTFLLGFLFVLLIPAVFLLVAVTIVGLLVIWLVPIAYLVSLGLGMGASGFQVAGPLIKRYVGMKLGSVATALAGVLMYMIPWALVAVILGTHRGGAPGFGIFLLVISILGTIYPLATGVGAAVITRFGFRPYFGRIDNLPQAAAPAPTPAPPPIPDGPAPARRPSPGPDSTPPQPPSQGGSDPFAE